MSSFPLSAKFFIGFISIGILVSASPSSAEERWAKVHQPNAELRQSLPAEAIDYGSFIWMPESALAGRQVSGRIQFQATAFEMTVGEQKIDPLAGFPNSEWYESANHTQGDFRLVQFRGPIKTEWLDELRASGIQPVQYLHPYSYIVWSEAGQLNAGRSLSSVRWTGEFVPAMRVPLQSQRTTETHKHSMALVHASTYAQTVNTLRQAGIEVQINRPLNSKFHMLQLVAAPEQYLDIARIAGIYTIQQIGQDAGPRGEMSNQSVVGGYDEFNAIFPGYLDWLNPTGLDGSGVIVGIVDGGVRETHQDLVDNMVDCLGTNGSCASTNDGHGTHVAGAVAGTGISGVTDSNGFLRGQGVAPGASLVEQLYPPFLGGGPGGMAVNGMIDIFRDSADSFAVLTNNSWGPTGSPQGYDIPTMQIDMITRDADPNTEGQQAVLPVWSIMNGNGDRNFGICQPSSLGSPDEAKNLFAVGSTVLQTGGGAQINDIFSISDNSAHGQACDGRQVPHIVAPGCTTNSTEGGNNFAYGFRCGTSMASPVVSGSVALFFEQYRNQFGIDPSPALVKARFTPVAMDLIGNTDANGRILDHRPDRMQGWGRLDLDAVINPSVPVQFIDQTVLFENTGENWQQVWVPANAEEPVRLMLSWTDAPGPGTGGTTPAWVNNLDLIVSIGDKIYYGNNISDGLFRDEFETPLINQIGGFSEANGAPDEINNLEGVMLSPEQHQGSAINIEVLATNLAGDGLDPWTPGDPRQDFALVCYNCSIPE